MVLHTSLTPLTPLAAWAAAARSYHESARPNRVTTAAATRTPICSGSRAGSSSKAALTSRSNTRSGRGSAERKIHVEVRDGTALLSGTVRNAMERIWAGNHARVNGVVEVDIHGLRVVLGLPERFASPRQTSNFTVPPTTPSVSPVRRFRETPPHAQNTITTLTDREIEMAIENELLSHPLIDAHEVAVSVRDGVAILSGKVQSNGERMAAIDSAEQGGATRIRDQLQVVPRER